MVWCYYTFALVNVAFGALFFTPKKHLHDALHGELISSSLAQAQIFASKRHMLQVSHEYTPITGVCPGKIPTFIRPKWVVNSSLRSCYLNAKLQFKCFVKYILCLCVYIYGKKLPSLVDKLHFFCVAGASLGQLHLLDSCRVIAAHKQSVEMYGAWETSWCACKKTTNTPLIPFIQKLVCAEIVFYQAWWFVLPADSALVQICLCAYFPSTKALVTLGRILSTWPASCGFWILEVKICSISPTCPCLPAGRFGNSSNFSQRINESCAKIPLAKLLFPSLNWKSRVPSPMVSWSSETCTSLGF